MVGDVLRSPTENLLLPKSPKLPREDISSGKAVKRSTLADDIATVLRRACREGDMEAAEHLLCALEAIVSREDAEERALQAYSALVQVLRNRRTG